MSSLLVWSTQWEQVNNWAPPLTLMPKCANHNRLATLHLEYVDLFHVFFITYPKQIPKKSKSVQMLDYTVTLSINTIFTWTSKYFTITKIKHHWCSCKVCIGVATNKWDMLWLISGGCYVEGGGVRMKSTLSVTMMGYTPHIPFHCWSVGHQHVAFGTQLVHL